MPKLIDFKEFMRTAEVLVDDNDDVNDDNNDDEADDNEKIMKRQTVSQALVHLRCAGCQLPAWRWRLN